MTKKRKDSHNLKNIKTAFADPAGLNRTMTATMGAQDLNMSDIDVIAVIQGLSKTDFDHSMSSFTDPKVWQDLYRPVVGGRELYVKFTLDSQGQLYLISFKEA